ncbi:MAG: hypothetical protein AB1757_25710 [Acidobacteriota bacterium]
MNEKNSLLVSKNNVVCRMEAAALVDVWAIFHPTETVGADEWPPISKKQWVVIYFFVFSISGLCIIYFYRMRMRKHPTRNESQNVDMH